MEKKRETLTEKTIRILTTIPRPFIVCIDGIWRKVEGVYILPLIEPFKIKYILNGLEYSSDSSIAIDVRGYEEKIIEQKVISKNLETLPPKLKQKDDGDGFNWTVDVPPTFRLTTNRTPRVGRQRIRRTVEAEVENIVRPEPPPAAFIP